MAKSVCRDGPYWRDGQRPKPVRRIPGVGGVTEGELARMEGELKARLTSIRGQ
jgi:hypothetical protein